MSVLVVIPARYASSRFPGKPLVALTGAEGQAKSLIRRSWEAAQAIAGVDRVVIATDDARIRDAAAAFGGEVVMTSSTCGNGTERVAEAHEVLGGGYDIVVNFQGDAPLTPPWFVADLIAGLRADPGTAMATPVLCCDGAALAGLLADRRAGRVGGTTAVFDGAHRALYFSKEVIPYTPQSYADAAPTPVFHHVGVYAFRPDALADYPTWTPGPLEALEGLEQLRFLENGHAILCVEVSPQGRAFWEVNNPEDVPRVEAMMAAMGMA
ncbi:manno-octulosonate cytidylyltransferase [Pseudooceanicola sp.]|uniref:3-deoxy-manno-octulosonate cytidylyltransferase n=1 Tax=Pseudooceanicola sp. TaxID=1914328 RepID=UPI0026349CDA|nr:manno-octulosonate cytidylyltransferase [Pseudooceanicola sp.]MDF1856669.1 3-deoxy-manno-octulosonate cytidylyltransferase [Pseudooceanicola sp.]